MQVHATLAASVNLAHLENNIHHSGCMTACCLQFELSARLERERLEATLAEVTAAKQRVSEQLASAQQVGSRCTHWGGTSKLHGPHKAMDSTYVGELLWHASHCFLLHPGPCRSCHGCLSRLASCAWLWRRHVLQQRKGAGGALHCR